MGLKKIAKNKYIKRLLTSMSLGFLEPKDSEIIKELKDKFTHTERSFYYNKMKYLVDSLYCHAVPGTLETIVLKLNSFEKKGKVLNLGGGVGQVSNIIEALGFDTTNVDIELDKENSKNIKFDLNGNETLKLEEKSFDHVVCQEIIEHVENPWKLLRLAKQFLKPGGKIFLTTPNIQSHRSKKLFSKLGYFEWFSPDALSYHINPLPVWEIELICDKLDLEIIEMTGNGEYYFTKKRARKDIINNNENLIFIITSKE